MYKARYIVDQQTYAIKKIVLRAQSHEAQKIHEELERMLKEVRLFAAINDLHIIRYNHSWLEISETKTEGPAAPSEDLKVPATAVELNSPYIGFADPDGSFGGSHSASSHGGSSKGRQCESSPSSSYKVAGLLLDS